MTQKSKIIINREERERERERERGRGRERCKITKIKWEILTANSSLVSCLRTHILNTYVIIRENNCAAEKVYENKK